MSRSVSMPASRSLEQTGSGPISSSFIRWAALSIVLSGAMHSHFGVITSLTCMEASWVIVPSRAAAPDECAAETMPIGGVFLDRLNPRSGYDEQDCVADWRRLQFTNWRPHWNIRRATNCSSEPRQLDVLRRQLAEWGFD